MTFFKELCASHKLRIYCGVRTKERPAGRAKGSSEARTWSMAHGMRQPMRLLVPNMCGKTLLNDGAACTAGKATLPMLSSSVKPKVFFALCTLTCTTSRVRLACCLAQNTILQQAHTTQSRTQSAHKPGTEEAGIRALPEILLTMR